MTHQYFSTPPGRDLSLGKHTVPVLIAVAAVAAVAAFGGLLFAHWQENREPFTTELMLDTIGTKGFHVRRVLDGRTLTGDAIMAARESLIAQQGLCPRRFDILKFEVTNLPPVLQYEAKVRCR